MNGNPERSESAEEGGLNFKGIDVWALILHGWLAEGSSERGGESGESLMRKKEEAYGSERGADWSLHLAKLG